MRTLFFISYFLSASTDTFAVETLKPVKYEYKKYEKFDMEEIGVEGDNLSPGDISISPRLKREFKNRLPDRENFNSEMQKAINGIR